MAGVGSKYVQLLMNRSGPGMNNGTHAGGLAHALQQGMAAYMMGRKDKRDQTEALRAVAAGMRPAESAGTVEGFDARARFPTMPESMGEGIVETPGLKAGETVPGTGGFRGGLSALLSPELADNAYAGKLAQDLLLKDVERRQMVDLLNLKGAQAKELRMSPQWQPDVPGIREYEAARDRFGYAGTYQEFLRDKKMSLNGDPAAIREWAEFKKMPPAEQERFLNMKRANRPVNIGGSMVIPSQVNPGAVAGEIEKTLAPEQLPETKAAQAQAVEEGKARGEAQVALGGALQKAEQTLSVIDKALAHPGLSDVIGVPTGAELVPGTQAANFKTVLDQLQGQAFLAAFETLKGGGQITEVEGKKATQAMARLGRTQSEEEFKKSLQELRQIVQMGAERAQQKANPGGATYRPEGGNNYRVTPPPGFNIVE